MAADPRHARLLLAIVHERWSEAQRLSQADPPAPAAFVAQCRESDVHPWIHHRLTAEDRPQLVGEETIALLGELRRKVRRDNLLLLARAEQALDRLLAADVRPVALKGLDFLHRIYDSFDVRTIDDVDLLIRREQLDRSLATLRQAGWQLPSPERATHYIRSSHHLPLDAPGPVGVGFEIHWNLAQQGRYRIDAGALIDRARPLDVAGRTILRLEDTDVVAHLLVHHLSHYFDRRLKWVVDLQQLARRSAIDWDAVARRIRDWNAAAAAAGSLLHLRKLAPELIPERALRLLPLRAWRRALLRPLLSRHPLELVRGARRRRVQLYLAAVMIERPARLPAWLLHRLVRDRRPSDHPLDTVDPRSGPPPRGEGRADPDGSSAGR